MISKPYLQRLVPCFFALCQVRAAGAARRVLVDCLTGDKRPAGTHWRVLGFTSSGVSFGLVGRTVKMGREKKRKNAREKEKLLQNVKKNIYIYAE